MKTYNFDDPRVTYEADLTSAQQAEGLLISICIPPLAVNGKAGEIQPTIREVA